jgi:uncharacterized protein YggE
MNSRIPRWLVTTIQVVAIAALSTLAVVGITRAFAPQLAINQVTTNKMTTFDVTGESKIATIPDQAEVRMGIQVNESSVKAAQDQANQVINTINTQLGELGIEKADIKTEQYSLYPNYDYQEGAGQRITGYAVNAQLLVTMTDFTKLNQAIDMATSAGANQIGGITFSLSDDKQAEVEKQAREEAITNAKTNAGELARLAGMRLGKIVNVMESPMPKQPVYPMADMAFSREAAGAGGGAPTNVEPGSTSYTYTVTLSYETL